MRTHIYIYIGFVICREYLADMTTYTR